MKIAPASTSSSPASIRSAVVFPEPDGPTSTMNSPSSMWRSSAFTAGAVVPAYMRLACTKRTSATARAHLLGRGKRLAQPLVRGRGRAELVEPAQRGAEHRRGVCDEKCGVRSGLAHPRIHRAEETRVARLEEPAAEDDGDGGLREPET